MSHTRSAKGGENVKLAEQCADTPRLAARSSNLRKKKEERLKPSTYLGMLLFLSEQKQLVEDQLRFVRKLQGKLRFSELEKAIELCKKLKESPRSAARARVELERLTRECPRISSKSIIPEQRRIGVGYKDKGALRLSHEDHDAPSRSWWSEDIEFLLLDKPEEPTWITSEQLFGMDQKNDMQRLIMLQFIQNCSSTTNLFEKYL